MYQLLADFTVILHLLFIVFVVVGGFLAIKWPKLIYLHVPAAMWAAYIEFTHTICPLTPLENWLRREAGQAMYEDDFIERYVLPVIYPVNLTAELQIILGVAVLVINGFAYGLLIYKRR